MTRVEEIKALVDKLTPEERGALCSYWHPNWSEEWERDATRVEEKADSAASIRVKEIKALIDALSPREQAELNQLVQNWPDDEWDEQMKADAKAGKLDWMFREAEEDAKAGRLSDWPEPPSE